MDLSPLVPCYSTQLIPTPTLMPTYSIFTLDPLPISPAQLTAYKTLRLTSLQIDPDFFGSNYAREVVFTEDVWRERLDSPFKQTLIVSALPDDLPVHEHDNDNDNDNEGKPDLDAGEKGEWIGTASIVGPSGLPPFILAPFREAGISANWEMYALYSMWVHPAHRGKGLGARLVEACLEWARTNVDAKFSSENGGDFEKVVVLIVWKNNVTARALYSRVGFADVKGVSSREGQMWMLAKA